MIHDKRDISLILLQQFVKLKQDCMDFQVMHSSKTLVEFKDYEISFKDINALGLYYFTISDPAPINGPPPFNVNISWRPKNHVTPTNFSMRVAISAVPDHLNSWLGLIKAYNEISLDVNDRFLSKYENDLFEEYQILEDDADTSPFGPQQQKLLECTLQAFQGAIEITEMPADFKEPKCNYIFNLAKRKFQKMT